jgi:hypothetical protein
MMMKMCASGPLTLGVGTAVWVIDSPRAPRSGQATVTAVSGDGREFTVAFSGPELPGAEGSPATLGGLWKEDLRMPSSMNPF